MSCKARTGETHLTQTGKCTACSQKRKVAFFFFSVVGVCCGLVVMLVFWLVLVLVLLLFLSPAPRCARADQERGAATPDENDSSFPDGDGESGASPPITVSCSGTDKRKRERERERERERGREREVGGREGELGVGKRGGGGEREERGGEREERGGIHTDTHTHTHTDTREINTSHLRLTVLGHGEGLGGFKPNQPRCAGDPWAGLEVGPSRRRARRAWHRSRASQRTALVAHRLGQVGCLVPGLARLI